jgi:hypothetical protein
MTTAFTAMPVKMTTSAMRFPGFDMGKIYPTYAAASIHPDHDCVRNNGDAG